MHMLMLLNEEQNVDGVDVYISSGFISNIVCVSVCVCAFRLTF